MNQKMNIMPYAILIPNSTFKLMLEKHLAGYITLFEYFTKITAKNHSDFHLAQLLLNKLKTKI